MISSRYVVVLRKTGDALRRCNLVETKTNLKITFPQLIKNSPIRNFHAKIRSEISQIPVPISSISEISNRENVSTVESKISNFDSDGAAISQCGEKNSGSPDELTNDDVRRSDELPGALEPSTEDISWLAPYVRASFNFAAYADDSETIRQLAKLGVQLHRIEGKNKAMNLLLRRNFDEMKPFITFLNDCGVSPDAIGDFITTNPYIFTQDIDDLRTRIRYLRAHKFDRGMIARIVEKNPYWLMFSTKRIDERLGFFQRQFKLSGSEVRFLATKRPNLITNKIQHLNDNIFGFKEEMGFDVAEMRAIVLGKPGLFAKSRKKLVALFDYIHNTMGIPHAIVSNKPIILTCRLERLRQRHKYLEALGKNQYDPNKPLYVSPEAITVATDDEFCRDIAKTSVETYELYLRSL